MPNTFLTRGAPGNFPNAQTFCRKSVALACRRFEGAHTYDRVAELLYDINKEFGISGNKIIATVTDNGSNFVKAFKEFGIKIALVNDINDDDNDELEDRDNGPGSSDNIADTVDNDRENVDVVDVGNIINMSSNADMLNCAIVLPTHIRCASHTLSLVATTDASAALKNSAAFARMNHAVMGKCTALWNACSRPKSA